MKPEGISEHSPTPENLLVTEAEVVASIEKDGFENVSAKELFLKYTLQCEAEAQEKKNERPADREVLKRANIECAVKVASVYLKTTKYKNFGLEILKDELALSSQSDSTKDLADKITVLINSVK